ncbi:hypothetical protein AUI06_07245 [archaeon 13_2_20CM_2_52_21]|nr:MAG: hypothetical protein AUI06_07245 [archaeon 13_2_20CM_2_52_21]OLD44582.1 MAG: hypothetical protein AUI51_01570 [archaeon 13_1_40CM_2_52_4]
MLSSLVGAVGSTRTARNRKKAKSRGIQLVSWAGRANTDAWFLAQLEQSRSRGLIYYAKNQFR